MDIYTNNMKKILNYQLAIESYKDNTNSNLKDIDEIFMNIKDLRNNQNYMKTSKKVELSNEIIEKIDRLMNYIGLDKFVFYDDDYVEYKWDYSIDGGKKDE